MISKSLLHDHLFLMYAKDVPASLKNVAQRPYRARSLKYISLSKSNCYRSHLNVKLDVVKEHQEIAHIQVYVKYTIKVFVEFRQS